MSDYTVKVEEARPANKQKPAAGPVYRYIYAKDGLMKLPAGMESPWDFFSESVKRNPKSHMLGCRQSTDGKVGPYTWLTCEEVYDASLQIGSVIRRCGVNP
ncbi:unnamed protein product, partial [Ilex paraguariensis]